MAITFDITVPEIFITTGQVTETAQNLLNAIRLFEDDFQMMSNSHIADASGKAPLGGGIFTEIILTLLEGNEGPWTIRFADEATQHTSITGGTFLATDSLGNARVVTTNPALTINQSVSGTLVETGVSGLTPVESTAVLDMWTRQGLDASNPLTFTPSQITAGTITINITGDGETTTTFTRA